ncbi:MAG: hypothetical protein GXO26_02920 [Crenarchaeota archaeon]|nr:hypothetical protein [Thermoproteota archaeon]
MSALHGASHASSLLPIEVSSRLVARYYPILARLHEAARSVGVCDAHIHETLRIVEELDKIAAEGEEHAPFLLPEVDYCMKNLLDAFHRYILTHINAMPAVGYYEQVLARARASLSYLKYRLSLVKHYHQPHRQKPKPVEHVQKHQAQQ